MDTTVLVIKQLEDIMMMQQSLIWHFEVEARLKPWLKWLLKLLMDHELLSSRLIRDESAPTVTPTAGVLLGSGERAEGYVRRGMFYLEKSGCVPACVDVVQRWGPVRSFPFNVPSRIFYLGKT
eukprot:scaffold421301_cov52-Attheya_sp.AAC.1